MARIREQILILNGKAGISADMSLRLSAAFGTHAETLAPTLKSGMSCKPITICGGYRRRNSPRLSLSIGLRKNENRRAAVNPTHRKVAMDGAPGHLRWGQWLAIRSHRSRLKA
jgi:hypothetical protein